MSWAAWEVWVVGKRFSGLLFRIMLLLVLYCPSFGEVRAEVFFLVEGRGGRAGNLHLLLLLLFQTSTLHVRVL